MKEKRKIALAIAKKFIEEKNSDEIIDYINDRFNTNGMLGSDKIKNRLEEEFLSLKREYLSSFNLNYYIQFPILRGAVLMLSLAGAACTAIYTVAFIANTRVNPAVSLSHKITDFTSNAVQTMGNFSNSISASLGVRSTTIPYAIGAFTVAMSIANYFTQSPYQKLVQNIEKQIVQPLKSHYGIRPREGTLEYEFAHPPHPPVMPVAGKPILTASKQQSRQGGVTK